MHLRNGAFAVCGFLIVLAQLGAQGPPPQPPPAGAQAPAPQAPTPQQPQTQAPPAGRGQGRGRGQIAVFPAQQRTLADPAVIERGRSIYSATCSACHGVDLRGGQLGGPNLLRSQLVLNDQHGELILPVIRGSRAERGMPPLPLPDDDVVAVSEYIHSVAYTSAGQGAPPPSAAPPPDIVVGDAAAGAAYFKTNCTTCHSTSGDMQGIATRIADPKTLQNIWVSGGAAAGRGGRGAGLAPRRPVTVTVTLPSGEKLAGPLVRLDHFIVSVLMPDGTIRSARRSGDVPKVEVQDPLEQHRALLAVYTEKDIHDVTAFLVTLK